MHAKLTFAVITAMAVGLPAMSYAATLKADSMVCELPQAWPMLDAQNLTGKPGSLIMKRVAARIKYQQLMAQAQGILRSGAAQEERVRADAAMPGNSQAQYAQAHQSQQQASQIVAALRVIQQRCMATGAAQKVTIVDRRPISGYVEITMPIHGLQAKVWTRIQYLMDEGN